MSEVIVAVGIIAWGGILVWVYWITGRRYR